MADDFVNGLGGSGAGDAPGGGGGTNAGSTADILRNQVLSQLTTTLGQVTTALQAAFPQASTNLTTTATGGTHAVPANAFQFLTITINGVAYKVALFQ
jgi:hypothetical protein